MSQHIDRCGWGFWAASLSKRVNLSVLSVWKMSISKLILRQQLRSGGGSHLIIGERGYATEGAMASLRYGFEELKLEKIVSFTAVQNMRSRAVMERIGMHHDPKDDFDHPRLPEGPSLKKACSLSN